MICLNPQGEIEWWPLNGLEFVLPTEGERETQYKVATRMDSASRLVLLPNLKRESEQASEGERHTALAQWRCNARALAQ